MTTMKLELQRREITVSCFPHLFKEANCQFDKQRKQKLSGEKNMAHNLKPKA
jgi:hypothetical protein